MKKKSDHIILDDLYEVVTEEKKRKVMKWFDHVLKEAAGIEVLPAASNKEEEGKK